MRGLVFCGFVLLLFGLSNALECYTCSSHTGIPNSMNDCDRFNFYDNHRKSLCMPGDQVCAKYIVNHDGMTWLHRSCKPYDICSYLRSVYSNGRDQLLECSTCSDRNLCNSGITSSGSVVIILTLLYLVL